MSDALYRQLVEEGLSGASLAQEYLRRLPSFREDSTSVEDTVYSPPEVTEDSLRERLMGEAKATSYRRVATRYGLTAGYIHQVAQGKMPVSERLAERLGYRRKVVFEPISVDSAPEFAPESTIAGRP